MKRVLQALSLLILSSTLVPTVEAASDSQLWLKAGLNYRATKKSDLMFRQRLRFTNDIADLEHISPELSWRYRVKKFLRVRAGYRLTAKQEIAGPNSHFDLWHRLFGDLYLRHRMKPVLLKYRFRFQEVFGRPRQSGEMKFKHTIRNRLGVEWKAGKGLSPFLSTELFVRINDNDGLLHAWRITPGVGYRIKKNRFSLFYRFERMLNGAAVPSNNIIGVSYAYDL